MADIVENVLREAAEKDAKYKTTEVKKHIELDIDVGNLAAFDPNVFDVKSVKYVVFNLKTHYCHINSRSMFIWLWSHDSSYLA